MNTERFLELLRNDEVQEKIKDLYCKLQVERFTEGSHMGSGWGWTIILDEDGEVDYMYASSNNTRMDVYNGSAMEVAFISDDAEVSTDSMGEVEDVKDYEEFIKHLENEFELYILEENVGKDYEEDEDYEEKKKEYVEENAHWMKYCEFNQDGFREVEIETWETLCDLYSYDEITDKIYDLIEDLDNQLEYQKQFEQEEF